MTTQWRDSTSSGETIGSWSAPTTGTKTQPAAGPPSPAVDTAGESPTCVLTLGDGELVAAEGLKSGPKIAAAVSPAAGVKFPRRRVEAACIGVAELGCIALLGGLYFLPKGIGHSEFLDSVKTGGSLASIPGMLQMAEFVAGGAGLVLIPLMAGARRGRMLLNVGFGLMGLLILSLLSQYSMGFNLVFMPMLALLSLVFFDTIARFAHVLPQEPNVARWRLATACMVTGVWLLPALGSLRGANALLGVRLPDGSIMGYLLTAGCIAGEVAGLLGLLAYAIPQSKITLQLARLMGVVAMMSCSLVALVATLTVSGVLRGDMHWFGVELVWIILLVFGCLMLVWSGMMQRLAVKAQESIQERVVAA